jgi:serine phosphatase RsbU (regulator of sigma subunit)
VRYLSLILLFVSQTLLGQIVLTDDNLNKSLTDQTVILEDPEHELTINDILTKSHDFQEITHEIEILDFNSSRWWMKFSVTNNSSENQFVLELARPITNKIFLYEHIDDSIVYLWKGGDALDFSEKTYEHRKNLYIINLDSAETKHFIVELESDGEVVTLPVKFWQTQAFLSADYDDQLGHGFYYGLLVLVSIIFFFFYRMLKAISFLYYVLYVLFQILLQFSLDGYTFQYLFPSNAYMANHMVVFSAGGAVIFVMLYARYFLKLKKRHAKLDRIMFWMLMVVGFVTLLSAFPGPTYEMSYPLINGVSLISTLYIIACIFILKKKGFKICNYFTAAFVILITGVVIFILGNFHVVGNAQLSQMALKWSSALEVVALSLSMANKYRELQAEKEFAQEKALKSLAEKNKLADEMNVQLEQQVKERTAKIEHQKEELAVKNEDIMASIEYANRIQNAILPSNSKVKSIFPSSFIFYRPRDVVSGDFYFIEQVTTESGSKISLAAAVDCTGHGVPGAFMSIVGNNFLTQTLTTKSVNTPAQALDFLNAGVRSTLSQNEDYNIHDGMDMALCSVDFSKLKLYFAGAKNPVYIVRHTDDDLVVDHNSRNPFFSEDGKLVLHQIKGDKHPIGHFLGKEQIPFTDHEFDLRKGDMIYTFSDGYADQFGGPKGKKFNYKTFKKLLLRISQEPVAKQEEILKDEFYSWMKDYEQIDDVLVIGIRV